LRVPDPDLTLLREEDLAPIIGSDLVECFKGDTADIEEPDAEDP